MNILDEELLQKIKDEAIENYVPILRDNTMNLIEEKLKDLKPKNILEVGTAVGYSAIKFSKYLSENGNICTIERNEKRYAKALENVKMMKLESVINIIFGDANSVLKDIDGDGKYDVIFIDAAKGQYINFFNEARRLIKNGGLIIADNVLFHGMVMSDYNEHKNRTAVRRLREFLKIISEDKLLEPEVVDIDDGVAFIKVNKL